jgi:hypothetical protein
MERTRPQATRWNTSSRLIHSRIWFQLVKVRLAGVGSVHLNEPQAGSSVSASANHLRITGILY